MSITTSEDAEKVVAKDIRDLVRYEPGVEVSSDSRFGESGFNIRGMDQNRVKITVDGVDQAKAFGYEKSLQSQRNFFDVENMKQLDIVKGPASSIHGSDAIGGVAAFTTKDPADYLNVKGDDTYLSLKSGYNSSDSSFNEALTFANRIGDLESLLVYSRRDGKETETYGGRGGKGLAREEADPMNYRSDNVLGKLQYQLNENHRIGLTAEWLNSRSNSELLSQDGYYVLNPAGPGMFHKRLYTNQSSEDQVERKRIGFSHEWQADNIVFDDMKWSLNWQESKTTQKTKENFTGQIVNADGDVIRETNNDNRLKDYQYSEKSLQLDATFNKLLEIKGIEHFLTYGLSAEDKTLNNTNNTIYLDDSSKNKTENWMPKIGLRQYGLFVQDEISLMSDRLIVTPGIRYDSFKEKIKSSGGYSGGASLEDQSYDSWTARLGTVYEINNTWSAFAQYSQGFSTPDMFSKYFGYQAGGVTVSPNPELKPEESDSIEVGLRANNHLGSMEVTAFYNDYENFIEETCVSATGCTSSTGSFQYKNLSEATIKGLEFKGMMRLDEALGAPKGSRLKTAIAWAKGRGTKQDANGVNHENEPLNTIAPLTAVLGLGYDAPSQLWGSDVMWTMVLSKKSGDISNMSDVSASGDQGDKFASPGYGIVDFTAYYKPYKGVTVNAGIFNVTDKKYWIWNDVRNLTSNDQGLNRYTQPGRNYAVSVKWEI